MPSNASAATQVEQPIHPEQLSTKPEQQGDKSIEQRLESIKQATEAGTEKINASLTLINELSKEDPTNDNTEATDTFTSPEEITATQKIGSVKQALQEANQLLTHLDAERKSIEELLKNPPVNDMTPEAVPLPVTPKAEGAPSVPPANTEPATASMEAPKNTGDNTLQETLKRDQEKIARTEALVAEVEQHQSAYQNNASNPESQQASLKQWQEAWAKLLAEFPTTAFPEDPQKQSELLDMEMDKLHKAVAEHEEQLKSQQEQQTANQASNKKLDSLIQEMESGQQTVSQNSIPTMQI